MARARGIKPGFFRNADLVELPVETRLLFIGLWTIADKAGRLEDRPKQIKMELYPADSFDVDAMLQQLHDTGFIQRYEHNKTRYIQVVNFSKHQNPHRDEKASSIPAPCEHSVSTVQAPCKEETGTVAIGLTPSSLTPDSLNTEENHLSGKPDASPKDLKNSALKNQAIEILEALNEATSRSYQPVDANLKLIVARLKEGAEPEHCKRVIGLKCADWATDPKMSPYLRPATLFNREKFWQYHGELYIAPKEEAHV